MNESNQKPATTPRPEIVKDEHLDYLDVLRASAITNMFGAAPYIAKAFALDLKDARIILSYWMDSYRERHTQ